MDGSVSAVKPNKQERILLAAAKVISKKGYHNTQMDDIAAEAGVAKGTLYLYFESKQDLFAKFIDNIFLQTFVSLQHINSIHTNSIEKIRMYIKSQLEFFSKQMQFFKIIIKEIHAIDEGFDQRYKQKIHARYHKTVDILAKIIKGGIKERLIKPVDSELAAFILTNIIKSVIFQNIRRKNKMSISRQTLFIMDIFLRGAGK